MNPILVEVFGYEIRYYSALILMGVIIAYVMIMKETKKFKLDSDMIFNLIFWSLIIGIGGARLYYVMFNWEYFGSHVNEIWQIWQGGLAIHGGILSGLLVLYIYSKKNHLNFIKMLDIIAVPLILAQAIGRWGNFFNQEAYGVPVSLTHLQNMHIPNFIIDGMNINGIYYTPTFLYESLWCLTGFIVLYILRKMKYTKVGQISGLYLVWYGIGRFFIESQRTDSLIFLGFKMAQFVSIGFIIIGLLLIVKALKKNKYECLYSDISNTHN